MKELKLSIKQYWLAAAFCTIFVMIIDYFFDTVCYTEILFGIPCPFSGITRATKLMLTGNFIESFQMHSLLILVIIGVVLYILLKSKSLKYRNVMVFYGIISLIIFIVFYIYRMKVYYPNVEPMIYKEDNILSWIINIIN
ncbi:MAG: DUF2752 domain-containing protein [Clostridiales bacterium]|nr:DUF2752 domain-containing protein [Clostridiales bacterium]